jgi:ribosomal protein L32
MYDERIEQLISAALADGVLTEKEKQVLFKKAHAEGIDLDEFEIILDAKLLEAQEAEKKKREKAAPKSDKYADVKKCPACGNIIPPNTKVCPGCGMVFSNEQNDIKEIAQLQDNYVKICEVKPVFPTGPLYLSIYVLILLLNILPWIYSFVCHLGWLGLAIPVTVITLIIIVGKFIFGDSIDEDKRKKKTFAVFNSQYDSFIGEHHKLLSTAQSFYAQDKSVAQRIDEVDNKVQTTIAQNAKTNKVYMSLSYGTLALTIILSFVFSFGWFSKTMDRHSYIRTKSLIEKAFEKGKIVKAEKYFHEFVEDWDMWNADYLLAKEMLKAFIALDNEEKILYYAGKGSRDLYNVVVDYYVSKEKYQESIDYSSSNVYRTYGALNKCIKDLMRKNKKDEAIKLLKANSYLFNSEKSDSDYYRPKVVKELTALTKE